MVCGYLGKLHNANNRGTCDHNTPVTHAALLEMWPRHVFLSFYSHNSTASCLYGAETASLMCCRVPGAFFQVLSCSLSFPPDVCVLT